MHIKTHTEATIHPEHVRTELNRDRLFFKTGPRSGPRAQNLSEGTEACDNSENLGPTVPWISDQNLIIGS